MQPQVELVRTDDIYVGERQRKEYPDKYIEELRGDILRDGLIHAIATNMNYNLVVGGCRLRAIQGITQPYKYGSQEIPAGYIPVVRINEGDDRVLFRIELHENLRRKNLTPVEEAQAITKLHHMFKESNPDQSRAETGAALDAVRGNTPRLPPAQIQEVSDSLLLDSFADDPEVKRAATRREAVRIAKKKLEQEFLGGLGALQVSNVNSDFTLIQGKCEEVFARLPAESFNGIVTDPPYGMGADDFGEQTSATGHQYKDDIETALDVATIILRDGYHLCKPDAHLYMFCDIRQWPLLCALAKEYKWLPFATPLIWHKPGLGHAPQPGYFGRRYECLLFAQKGNRKLSKSASDVLTYPAVKDKVYAAQKPTELLSEILSLSFYPGEHILDPCVGSGSLFRAAKMNKMKATGIDDNPIAIGLARSMINAT
jgi:DNA modification methylase